MSQRMTVSQALELYCTGSLHELGSAAHRVTLAMHPAPVRTYVVDRNINYSNVCTAGCKFCNFHRHPGEEGGYVLDAETVLAKVAELVAIGGTQVLMQGGLHPDLSLEWIEQLLRAIKSHFPSVHLHSLSPPEVCHLADKSSLPVADVLSRLRDAGLDSLPGGGAEILVDRVRRRISPGKCSADEWLEVMRQAHRLGMKTSATMMFGHVETDAERIEHLARIRDLQDETGGFIAFIPWTFQHERTDLTKWLDNNATAPREIKGPALPLRRDAATPRRPSPRPSVRLAGSVDYLRTLAMSRLFLDNVPNIQASWVTQGPKVGQLALFYGANDMGSVMMEENVVSSAGASFRLDEASIRGLISSAGFVPRRRNQGYQLIE